MEFNAIVKEIEVKGRKFTLYEPAGYEVDAFLVQYYDDDMNPIREKLPDANLSLIKMCFKLTDDDIKALPSSVYYKLLNEAAIYFNELNGEMGTEKK